MRISFRYSSTGIGLVINFFNLCFTSLSHILDLYDVGKVLRKTHDHPPVAVETCQCPTREEENMSWNITMVVENYLENTRISSFVWFVYDAVHKIT